MDKQTIIKSLKIKKGRVHTFTHAALNRCLCFMGCDMDADKIIGLIKKARKVHIVNHPLYHNVVVKYQGEYLHIDSTLQPEA